MSAVRTLIHLGNHPGTLLTPRTIAGDLRESPAYLAKVSRLLVRAGILKAGKGAKGGVCLGRPPAQITLLAIVEACQGTIAADHCQPDCHPATTCSYHDAAEELRGAVVGVLSKWTLALLMEKPRSSDPGPGGQACMMTARVRTPMLEVL